MSIGETRFILQCKHCSNYERGREFKYDSTRIITWLTALFGIRLCETHLDRDALVTANVRPNYLYKNYENGTAKKAAWNGDNLMHLLISDFMSRPCPGPRHGVQGLAVRTAPSTYPRCRDEVGKPMRPTAAETGKEPLDIDEIFRRLRRAVAGLPKAAMFELRDRGYGSPFEQLVGSLISARTRDETTVAVCLRLFQVARTPEALAALDEPALIGLLHGASFPEPKARDLLRLARQIVTEHGGRVPDSMAALTAFRGVGPKIAALTLAVGFGRPAIAVDVHVHRVTNRWGYVATATPEKTMAALAATLPERYWIEINERLVPFGKAICTAARPKCATCLLLSMCRQVGVLQPR